MNAVPKIPRINTPVDSANELNLNSWIAQSITEHMRGLVELPPVSNINGYRGIARHQLQIRKRFQSFQFRYLVLEQYEL